MRQLKIATLFLMLAMLAVLVTPIIADYQVVWNESGVYVTLNEITPSVVGSVAFNAYYENETSLHLVAIALTNPTGEIKVELYDYYNKSNSAAYNFTLSPEEKWEKVVDVWSNRTVILLFEGDTLIGAFYVDYIVHLVSLPTELMALGSFMVAGLFIAFAARGNSRDAGLGMIAFGILAPALIVLGFPSAICITLSALSITIGVMLIIEAAKER